MAPVDAKAGVGERAPSTTGALPVAGGFRFQEFEVIGQDGFDHSAALAFWGAPINGSYGT
jgi:hypothetical protein